ncbi:hypothetical protein RDABS01_001925 [Bienertia sinuspersici]
MICSPWRSAAKEAKLGACCNKVDECHTLSWLLLPERDESSRNRRFYSLSKQMVRHISLPSVVAPDDGRKKRVLSSHGWLLVVSESEDNNNNNKVSLFKPFSGAAVIKLPDIKIKVINDKLAERDNSRHNATRDNKFVLSDDPSATSNFIVFLTCIKRDYNILVFWRNGDSGWTRVEKPPAGLDYRFVTHHCHDITFYQGEFYGVDTYGKVVKFETASTASNTSSFRVVANLPNTLALKRISAPVSFNWFYNLVVSGGQLLVVRMVIKYEVRYRTDQQPKCRMRPTRFEVFELHVNNGNINQVLSLGNRSIFIGFNNSSFSVSVSVSVKAHGFKPNCIYYTDVQRILVEGTCTCWQKSLSSQFEASQIS